MQIKLLQKGGSKMGVQTIINILPATVVQGECAVSNPQGGQKVYTVTPVAGVQASFGKVFTSIDGVNARVGFATSTDKFVGIAVVPKGFVNKGAIDANNMNIFDGASVPMRASGEEIGVIMTNISTVGQNVEYDSAGLLYAITGSTPTANRVILANAKVVQNNTIAGKQATIKIGGIL